MSPRLLSILVGIVSLLWASLFTWTEIIDADPDQFSIKSARVKQEFANCSGSFAQRQACAEEITNRQQQIGFLVWCKKVAIILGPPLVLYSLVGVLNRQRSRAPEQPMPRSGGTGVPQAAPRRVRAQGPVRRDPELDAPNPDPHGHIDPAPLPDDPVHRPHGEGPGLPPIISGGRREPVRRRR